ncbi:hypothetical protein QE152_g5520 [Popillia japonica]|uniref:Transposase n=1 Tax=Popillia japonica TaxID=7064 RepID=A0AAW1MRA7_POPJA
MQYPMKNAISNELAEQYSWHGAKKKRILKKLKFSELLLSTAFALLNKTAEDAIMKWFRRAKERKVLLLLCLTRQQKMPS